MLSATRAGRRIALAVPIAASLLLSGFGAQAAWARPTASARELATAAARQPLTPGLLRTADLRITAKISLGGHPRFLQASLFAEAPNGTVFFARGSRVYVVVGTSAPVIAEHAGGKVLALAASSADLYVETGLTVTQYSRSSGNPLRHWKLSSPAPATSAGLLSVGGVLWSWTDWATDMSGFQYATVSRIVTSSAAVHVVAKQAFPGDMDANGSGLYYEVVRGVHDYLARVSPSGAEHFSRPGADTDAAVVLADGKVVVFGIRQPSGNPDVDIYSRTSLRRLSSKLLSDKYLGAAETGAGLLILRFPCADEQCAASGIGHLNPATAAVTGALKVHGASLILQGSKTALISVIGSTMYLVRLG